MNQALANAFDEMPTGGKGGSSMDMFMENMNAQIFKNHNDNVLQKCENCGRTFNPDRLAKHQATCTPGNAMKGPLKRGEGIGGQA